MTRRKRTNSNVPAKGRLRDMADRLWSLAVRSDWNYRCMVCGSTNVEAHHLVPRQHEATRYDLNNGVALCCRCHKFDKDVSPHLNAAGWMCRLTALHPERMDWYLTNCRPKFTGTKNTEYYCGVIRSLRQYVEPEEFASIVGQRFAAWLEETTDDGKTA